VPGRLGWSGPVVPLSGLDADGAVQNPSWHERPLAQSLAFTQRSKQAPVVGSPQLEVCVQIVWAGPFAQESVHATVHLPHRQAPEPAQSASTVHEASQRGGSAFFEDEQEAQAMANKQAPSRSHQANLTNEPQVLLTQSTQ
jgi:hypothetical protein